MIPHPAETYPRDLVAEGVLHPDALTTDQLWGGVQILDAHLVDFTYTQDGVFHNGWKLPAGLLVQTWQRQEDGSVPEYALYVDGEKGLQFLQRDESGAFPHDVAERIAAEARSRTEVERQLGEARPPVQQNVVRRDGQFVPPHIPEPGHGAFTRKDRKDLNKLLRQEAREEARTVAAATVAAMKARVAERLAPRNIVIGAISRGLAALRRKPTGRHHAQPHFA